jgi:hypothetical protein
MLLIGFNFFCIELARSKTFLIIPELKIEPSLFPESIFKLNSSKYIDCYFPSIVTRNSVIGKQEIFGINCLANRKLLPGGISKAISILSNAGMGES